VFDTDSSHRLTLATYLEGICHSEHGRNTRKHEQSALHSRYSSHAGKLNISVLFSLPSPCLKETAIHGQPLKNPCEALGLEQTIRCAINCTALLKSNGSVESTKSCETCLMRRSILRHVIRF
jgi:hypothetical protein